MINYVLGRHQLRKKIFDIAVFKWYSFGHWSKAMTWYLIVSIVIELHISSKPLPTLLMNCKQEGHMTSKLLILIFKLFSHLSGDKTAAIQRRTGSGGNGVYCPSFVWVLVIGSVVSSALRSSTTPTRVL